MWFYFRKIDFFPEKEEKPEMPLILQIEDANGEARDLNMLLLGIVGGGFVTTVMIGCLVILIVNGVIILPESPQALLDIIN